jgi:hypothetical protein
MRALIMVSFVPLGMALTVGGCGGGTSSNGSGAVISTQPLSGKIGGQSWSLAIAQSDSYLSMGDRFFVTMYPTSFTACETFGAPSNANTVIIELPKTAGSYSLGLDMNATLYEAATSNNRVATQGRVVIDSVTATTISGGANFAYDANNAVDGQFQATICP